MPLLYRQEMFTNNNKFKNLYNVFKTIWNVHLFGDKRTHALTICTSKNLCIYFQRVIFVSKLLTTYNHVLLHFKIDSGEENYRIFYIFDGKINFSKDLKNIIEITWSESLIN